MKDLLFKQDGVVFEIVAEPVSTVVHENCFLEVCIRNTETGDISVIEASHIEGTYRKLSEPPRL